MLHLLTIFRYLIDSKKARCTTEDIMEYICAVSFMRSSDMLVEYFLLLDNAGDISTASCIKCLKFLCEYSYGTNVDKFLTFLQARSDCSLILGFFYGD